MTQLPTPAFDRPVALALRSMLVMGAACTAFGLVFVVAFGFFNSFQRFRVWFIVMGTGLWLGPGVLYLVCAALMRRQRPGAAKAALATVAFQAVGAAALLTAAVTVPPISPIPIALGVMWLVGLADCARQLLRARRFLASATGRIRGFEMVVPKRALPLSDNSSMPQKT